MSDYKLTDAENSEIAALAKKISDFALDSVSDTDEMDLRELALCALACQVAGKSLERSVQCWATEEPTQ